MADGKSLQENGIKLFKQKDYEAAKQVFQQAIDAYQSEQNHMLAAEMQVNLGLVQRALGENQPALDVTMEAYKVFEAHKDSRRMAMAMGNLGGVYVELGDKEQAYNCYRRAADLFQELGEKQMYGETMIAMGRLQADEGKIGAAAATYEAGLGEMEGLNARQKMLKGLIGIRNKITGGS